MRILVVSVLLLGAACGRPNPNYCPDALDDNCANLPDAPMSCTASTPGCVCRMPDKVCVECTIAENAACVGGKPVCADNRCRECRSNAECGMGTCLEDGSCTMAPAIYASPTGAMIVGCGVTQTAPCSLAQALLEVGGTRPTLIRLEAGEYSVTSPKGFVVDKTATLAARGATFTRTGGAGPLITVELSQTIMKLIGGTLKGPNASDGIRCDSAVAQVFGALLDDFIENGIESNACDLTVERSTIRNNKRGGINMANTAAKIAKIKNNFVYLNGGLTSPVGGMRLELAPMSNVEFNTVISNQSDTMTAGGIVCAGANIDAPRNLVYRNFGGVGDAQVGGTCTFVNISFFQTAMRNTDDDVGFERPNDTANPSFRLKLNAIVRDVAECTAGEIDFEGDARPQGNKCDHGADEYRNNQ
jgi:hypothetical protein